LLLLLVLPEQSHILGRIIQLSSIDDGKVLESQPFPSVRFVHLFRSAPGRGWEISRLLGSKIRKKTNKKKQKRVEIKKTASI